MSSIPPSRTIPQSRRALRETFPDYEGQLAHAETVPAEEGTYVDPREVLQGGLADAFADAVGDLFVHQAEALDRLASGANVCVASSTSPGKTYVYALQIARNHLADRDATALLVYPTKALSRDQERELDDFFDDLGLDVSVRVYDGDTPRDRLKHIRETADVIITNFSGVNVYLGHHARWHSFFDSCERSRPTSPTRTRACTACTSRGRSADCGTYSTVTGAIRSSSAPPRRSAIRRNTRSD